MAKKKSFSFKDMFYYRKRITIAAAIIAALPCFFVHEVEVVPVFMFAYWGSVIFLDVAVYFLAQKRESDKISVKKLQSNDKMTPQQLDYYISHMVKMRLITFLVGIVGLYQWSLGDCLFFTIFIRGIYTSIRFSSKKFVYPARYKKIEFIYTPKRSPSTAAYDRIGTSTMDIGVYNSSGVITHRRH